MKKLAVLGLALALLSSAWAKTLAWYHFDEQDDGVQATCAEGAILDSSGNGRHGTVLSLRHKTSGPDAELAPTYHKARCGARVLTDGGSPFTNRSALEFTAVGTKSSQTGAVIRVDNFFSKGTAFGSLTVEAIVCTGGGAYDTFAPIVGLWQNATDCLSEYWSLMMNPDGKIAVRFNGTISGGTNYSTGTHKINDGKWHHIALVHDHEKDVPASGNPKVHVYVDGEWDADYAPGAAKQTYNASPLYIGGYTLREGRIFNGVIDEVRISDVALAPEEFLKLESPRTVLPIDDDTYAYVPFESQLTTVPENQNLNLVANGPVFKLTRSNQGLVDDDPIPQPVIEVDSPAAQMAGGRFETASWTDETCCHFKTNGHTNGSGCYGSSSAYLNDSWTAEIFFKTDGRHEETDTGRHAYIFRCGQGAYPCLFLRIGTYLRFIHNNKQSDGTYAPVGNLIGAEHEFDDGKWHHVAVMYDRGQKLMRCYVDYRLRYAGENVDLESKNYFFFINNNPVGDSLNFFNGCVDEFRLTRRVLRVDELLAPLNKFEAGRDTLLEASFENDWKVRSGQYPLADAEAVEKDGETVAFYEGDKDGRLRGDFVWTNQTEGAVCRTNLFAAKLSRGYVGFPDVPSFEGTDFTAEMFVKLETIDYQSCLFRLMYGNAAGYIGTPIIAVYASEKDRGNQLSCRLGFMSEDKIYGASSPDKTEWYTLDSWQGHDLMDHRWHHLAVTCKTEPYSGTDQAHTEQTTIKFYIDYEEVGQCFKSGVHLPFRSVYAAKPMLSIGTGSTDKEHFTGIIDEVRLSSKALEPSEFLTMTRRPRGNILLIR